MKSAINGIEDQKNRLQVAAHTRGISNSLYLEEYAKRLRGF